MLLLIFTSVFTIFTFVYVRWRQLKQYWAIREVPHVPPHPFYGSLVFLQKQMNISIWFRQLYNFKAPYYGIWVFWRPGLVINSLDIAKNILIKDQANFRNRLVSSGNTDPVGRLNLFSLKDPLWSLLRKHLTVLFTSSKLRNIKNLINKKSMELVERIEKERQKEAHINLRGVMTDFTTDIIGTASFGVVSDATLTKTSHLRKITEDLMRFSFHRALSWSSLFFWPEVADFFRFKMFPSRSTEYLRKILRIVIAQRGGFENKITEPKDLLDILIKLKQECGEELDMTENMILAQATVFLQGGFETTATALFFAVYELAYNPEVQKKLYKELQEAEDKCGDNLLDHGDLSGLIYLNCVVTEVLRKFPIFSWLDRVATADYRVNDQLTIEAGTPVLINVMGIHHDPEIYFEPDKFYPDRFLPENRLDNSFAFLTFGEGPRKCIGQRLGLANLRHGLSAIILRYEVKPLPNAPKPGDIRFDTKSLLTVPGDILSVEFVPRKKDQ